MVAGACLASLALITPSAIAEPNGPPTFRALAGSGSDTTQDVLNGLSDVVLGDDPEIPGVDSTKLIASYNASPPGNITTKDPNAANPNSNPNCTFARAVGSTNGVRALVRERTNARNAPAGSDASDPCLDFARSSANTSQLAEFNGTGLTYIPFAVDAVTYATRKGSGVSRNLTAASLAQIYTCTHPQQSTFRPLLPLSGSGTRTFFLQTIGLTDSPTFTTTNPCVSQVDALGNPLLENTGNLLTDARQIAPYSIAQYISQSTGVVTDVRGQADLRNLNGIPPVLLNTASTGRRDVYNVVPTSQLGAGTPTNAAFVGAGSGTCTNTNTITRFGFAVATNCGVVDPALQTPGGPTTP